MKTTQNASIDKFPPIFAVKDALEHGRTRRQVQRVCHTRVMSGIYAHQNVQYSGLELLRCFTTANPQVAVTSLTAAQFMGWRIPREHQDDTKIYAISVKHSVRIRQERVSFSRAAMAADEATVLNGVRLTTPERTVLELAKILSVRQLVVVLDGVLRHHDHREQQQILVSTKEKILALAQKYPGMRGVGKTKLALELAVTGSDSAMETELRLVLADYGVTHLVCNQPVRNEFGAILFEPDLADVDRKVSIQYEGEHHGGRRQVRTDVERARKTAEAGWKEVRIFFEDLYQYEWMGDSLMPRAVKLVKEALR